MKKILLIATVIVLAVVQGIASAENLTLKGDMSSQIRFEIEKTVTTIPGVRKLTLSFVVPASFKSSTYKQDIDSFDLKFTPVPEDEKTWTDSRGNRVVTASWKSPPEAIDCRLAFSATNKTRLDTVETTAPFPLTRVPQDISYYLKATDQVQSEDPRINDLSGELVRGMNTEFDAVQRILTFVVDYIHYVTPPAKYDAIYSLESGRGNCQNFSHLSAALMRSAGIPVRIVNGVTLNKPLDITREGGVITFKMGQGRHSWIEVWFPDLGWVPLDPQQTAMFVPNRFIRIEVGIDNNETINDGLVRWSQTKGNGGEPIAREVIHADFVDDKVNLNGRREAYGPKNFLLFPLVKAEAKTIETALTPPTPESGSQGIFTNLWSRLMNSFRKVAIIRELPWSLTRIKEKVRITFKAEKGEIEESVAVPDEGPVTMGNVDFPAEVDFAFPPAPAIPTGGDGFEKTRSFFVETAEYVTSKRTQYAQVFVLPKPLKIEKVGLALHKFGGDGQLWIDLYRDNNGRPGEIIATSEMIDLANLSEKPGYRWTDFPFSGSNPVMMPGNYWIGLGFTGSPIVNWFYTYGKPVGPAEGTRYKAIFDNDWSGALSYEFNYRIGGLVVK